MQVKLKKSPFIIAVLAIFMSFSAPHSALAQCEFPGAATAAGNALQAAQTAAVLAMQNAIKAAVETQRMAANAAVGAAINTGWATMQARLNRFWEEWLQAKKDQTKQLHAGLLDQSRQIASNLDAANQQVVIKKVQQREFEAKTQHIVSDEACRFDTTAKYLTRNMQLAKAVSTGVSNNFNMLGNNTVGTPGAAGPAPVNATRWQAYVSQFCDPTQNGGNVACAATANANAHITPSKTIFGRKTINMDDPATREAVNQLVFNITGFETPEPIPAEVQQSAAGKEQRQQNREALAQRDAVGALVWSVIGERTTGETAAEILQTRQRMGVSNASDRPSEREIQQKVVEELWDPRFYVQLNDARGTIGQKEIYLKAYSLVLLYKIIEKTERISNVYAIQAANLLDMTDISRRDGREVDPVR